jgi:hypothetical protein
VEAKKAALNWVE